MNIQFVIACLQTTTTFKTMANMIRSAKSGNEWTMNELNAYNIQITFQDAATFFGAVPLPPPAVSEDILAALDADDAVDERVYSLLT